MEANRGKMETFRTVAGKLAALCLFLSGCSLGAGNRLTLFPQGHRMLDSAREISQSHPDAPPVPRELDKRPLPAYVVEPGDALLVVPADLDSPARLPGDQPVLPDGTIRLGRYGPLLVAGQTLDQIEVAVNALVKSLTKNAGPITVRVVSRVSKVYYVLGEVNSPGSFPLQGRETVLDGILAAGGLTDRASHHDIILSRPTAPNDCRVVLPVCYRQIVQLGDTSTNYQLAPGDRIFVASRRHQGGMFHRRKEECGVCGNTQVGCPTPVPTHVIHPEIPQVVEAAKKTMPRVERGAFPDVPEAAKDSGGAFVTEGFWRPVTPDQD
jgi:protein involved in polysaccharide export with SLBB domain